MTTLPIKTPFAAPVFFEAVVSSTMTVSCELAAQGYPHGTVIVADFQEAGRGRIHERTWEMEKGKSLAFTLLLRYSEIPRALTLRAGLAVCLAIEDFFPVLKGRVRIKWPNDIMADSKKICGIITEADAGTARVGIGVNVAQTTFPPHLQHKAASVSLASGADIDPQARFALLELILSGIFAELHESCDAAADNGAIGWRSRIEDRLYKKGGRAAFIQGAAESGLLIKGTLLGIGNDGELLLLPEGADRPEAFFSGELLAY